MQINLVLRNQKYLIYSLIAVITIWTTAYFLGKDTATITTDFLYLPLTVFMLLVGIYQLYTRHNKTDHNTWILFFIFSLFWLIAEHIWTIDELILGLKPFPSYADVGYFGGAAVLPVFFIMFILPFKEFITKRSLILSIMIGSTIFVSVLYLSWPSDITRISLTNFLLTVYPALDGITMTPAFIAMILFVKRKMQFSSFLLFFAVTFTTIADIMFQITTTNGTYYAGSLTEVFYFIAYVLFIFGVYNIHRIDMKGDRG